MKDYFLIYFAFQHFSYLMFSLLNEKEIHRKKLLYEYKINLIMIYKTDFCQILFIGLCNFLIYISILIIPFNVQHVFTLRREK